MQQVKTLDFTGKTIFCGIDVHKTSWSVCLSMEGMILKRFSQGSNPKDLYSTLNRLYPGANYKAVYEAGFCGFYPQRIMTSLGIDCIIVNPVCNIKTLGRPFSFSINHPASLSRCFMFLA